MSKKKVIVYERLEAPVLEDLQEKFDVTYFENIDQRTDPAFLAALKEAEGIIGIDYIADQAFLDKAPNLKVVSTVSVGYNTFDLDALTKRNVMASNTPGVLTDTVADAIFGLLLSTARRIPELDHYVKSKQWNGLLGPEYYGADVHHKTLGIIGLGSIGEAIAQRAHFGFDMDILYHTRTPKPEAEKKFKAAYRSLDDLLKESDFVLLMTPLTKETEGLIGKREFQLMKDSAIFINGSRGKTVVEKDLIEALENKEILTAGVDVFEQEPTPHDNPLLKLPHVVTLPHIGSSTNETEYKMSRLAADNLEAALTGERPPTLLNTSLWDKDN